MKSEDTKTSLDSLWEDLELLGQSYKDNVVISTYCLTIMTNAVMHAIHSSRGNEKEVKELMDLAFEYGIEQYKEW